MNKCYNQLEASRCKPRFKDDKFHAVVFTPVETTPFWSEVGAFDTKEEAIEALEKALYDMNYGEFYNRGDDRYQWRDSNPIINKWFMIAGFIGTKEE